MAVPIDTLNELIADAEAAVKAATDDWREARSRMDAADSELRVLKAILKRRTTEIESQIEMLPIETAVVRTGADWEQFARTEAVEQALRDLDGRKAWTSPADIETYLREHGRDDDKDSISGALAHLNRTKRAHRVGYAKWLVGPAPEPTTSAEKIARLALDGAGGDTDVIPEADPDHRDDYQRHDGDQDRGASIAS